MFGKCPQLKAMIKQNMSDSKQSGSGNPALPSAQGKCRRNNKQTNRNKTDLLDNRPTTSVCTKYLWLQ